jgi:uncharacterized membrane-anchored protein
MTTISGRWLALSAIFASQAMVLAWMVGERVYLLTTGREIALDVIPVDPRSLFRGDYVTLTYPAGNVQRHRLDGTPWRPGETVYVVLAQDQQSAWRPVISLDRAPSTVLPSQIVLRGVATSGGGSMMQVRFGIESYFVPEGDGRQIENDIAKKMVSVQVAVGSKGGAAIKSLLIDGKPVYTQSVF